MGSGRPFPLGQTTAKPIADRAAPAAPARESGPTWPILARIAEINHEGEPYQKSASAANERASYRVDTPHDSASRVHSVPKAETKPRIASPAKIASKAAEAAPSDAKPTEQNEKMLARVPLPIRLTVQSWRLVQPYLGFVRFAAMLTLMAIGGTSMTLMMSGGLHRDEAPPSPSSTAADQTSTLEVDPAPVAPQPSLEITAPPEAESSSIAPTAIGPASGESKPLMAIESAPESPDSTPAVVSTPKAPEPVIEAEPASEPWTFPSTSYKSAMPEIASKRLPQVQTTEPAIATLKGVVIETQSR